MTRLAGVMVLFFVGAVNTEAQTAGRPGESDSASIAARLKSTVVDSVEFNDVTLEAGLKYLGSRSGGTRFLILDMAGQQGVASKLVTLSLRGVSADVVLKYLCELGGCAFKIENRAVLVGTIADLKALDRLRRSNPPRKPGWKAIAGLQSTPLESIEWTETPMPLVVKTLREKTAAAHAGTPTNFVVLEDRADPKVVAVADRAVTMGLDHASALAALQYATELCGLGFRTDYNAVVIGTPERVAFKPGNVIPKNSPISKFLSATRIEKVRFAGIGMKDTIEAVRYYSGQGKGQSAGLNVIDSVGESGAVIDLHLDNVSLGELIAYVTAQSGTRVRTRGMTLIFEPDPAEVARFKAKGGTMNTTRVTPPPSSGTGDEGLKFD